MIHHLDDHSLARVEELRRAFDQRFAVPHHPRKGAQEDLLFVRLGGRRYAIRVRELRGLHHGRNTRPLPSMQAPMLGIAGIRGQLVPVYDLAALLGCDSDRGGRRWLAICGEPDAAVALAFDGFEGSTRVPSSDIHPTEQSAGPSRYTREIVRLASETCYVVDIPSVVASLTAPMPIAHGDE